MATELQNAANRRNALMSTGPRSLSGKARSRMNAVTHGLTAGPATVAGEDPAEFAALRNAMFSSLRPDGALESQLIERIVSLIWRMRRLPVFEVALLEWTAHYQAQRYDGQDTETDGQLRNHFEEQPPSDLQDSLKLGRTIEALLSNDLSGRLMRYETAMQRQLSMALRDFRELQRPRFEVEKAVLKQPIKLKNRVADPEDAPSYWAAKDRERMMKMEPP